MAGFRFAWHHAKAAANQQKHRVSFEEAEAVFSDERALLIEDDDPIHPEERFVLLGLSSALRVLVVCHCPGKDPNEIRIISARRANKAEQRLYWERLAK